MFRDGDVSLIFFLSVNRASPDIVIFSLRRKDFST